MTCIVGFIENKKVYIGGDSAGSNNNGDVTLRKDTKVFKKGKFIIGYTSSFRMGQLLRFKLKVKEQQSSQDDYEFMCTTFIDAVRSCLKNGGYSSVNNNIERIGVFLVGYKGRLYKIEGDLQVGENIKNYDSCGCGQDFALGTLFALEDEFNLSPEEKIKRALCSAVEFSGGVRPPFVIEKEI